MITALLDLPPVPVGFADDPIASHSAQFGLAQPSGIPAGHDVASPIGIRPWNLRAAQIMTGCGARPSAWRYDHDQQLAVTLDGHRMILAADPSADSVSDLDGDEGPNEDWKNDFYPDYPGTPA